MLLFTYRLGAKDMVQTRNQIRRLVLQFLAERFKVPGSSLNDTLKLRARFGLDDKSLGKLAPPLSKVLGASIAPSELIMCRTIGDVVDLAVGKAREAGRGTRTIEGPPAKPPARKKGAAKKKTTPKDHLIIDIDAGTRTYVGPGIGSPGEPKDLVAGEDFELPSDDVPADDLDKVEYRVWYGTNRKPRDPGRPGRGYGAERDNKIHYGYCRVCVPRSHKIGSVGSSWLTRLLTWTDDRLKIAAMEELAEELYWQQIRKQLAEAEPSERDAVIFIHGYRVPFQTAALRAAQIGFDLSVKGAMAFFSWPSQGKLLSYVTDSQTIEASEDAITEFLTSFVAQSGARSVHLIAHSMGNRGVLRAVNRIAEKAKRRAGLPFGQIILAAADVDADVFRQRCAAYAAVARRTTLYVSSKDLAVEASHWLQEFPRAGLLPPVFVAPGLDTINVTNADLTLLGHGYVAAARDVLADMQRLITSNAPPGQRFGLRSAKTEDGERYWLIGA